MTTLADLEYLIGANTQGMTQAISPIQQMDKVLEKLQATVDRMATVFEQSMARASRASQQVGDDATRSARSVETAMARQEAAIAAGRDRMLALNASVTASGAGFDIIQRNTQAFAVFEDEMRRGVLTSAEMTRAKTALAQAFNLSNRELTAFNRTQAEQAAQSKLFEAAMDRQQVAVEKVRGRYMDLMNAMNKRGTNIAVVSDLEQSFKNYEKQLSAGVLSSTAFTTAQNQMLAKLNTVKREAIDGAPTIRGYGDAIKEIAKGTQIGLGPLSGLSSRLTAFNSLTSLAGIIAATAITSIIGLGVAFIAMVKSASEQEDRMRRFNAVIDVMGDRAQVTAKEVDSMAKVVSKTTLATREGAANAAAALLTIPGINKEIFQTALLAAQGLSLVSRGDIETNMRRLAKVLEDPTRNLRGLTEAGVQFSAMEEFQIRNLQESGNLLGARLVVLERLRQHVAGAISQSQGLAGAWHRLGEASTDFFKKAGEQSGAVNALVKVLEDITQSVKDFEKNAELATASGQAFVAVVQLLAVAGKGAALVLAGLAFSVAIIKDLWKAIDWGNETEDLQIAMREMRKEIDDAADGGKNFSASWKRSMLDVLESTRKASPELAAALKAMAAKGGISPTTPAAVSVITDTPEKIRVAGDALAEFAKNHLKVVENSMSADNQIKRFNTTVLNLSDEGLKKIQAGLGLSSEQFERLRFIIANRLGSDLGKLTNDMKNHAVVATENVEIAKQQGQTAFQLAVAQSNVNLGIQSGLLLTRNMTLANQQLSREEKLRLGTLMLINAFTMEQNRLAQLETGIKEAKMRVDLAQQEVALLRDRNTGELQRAVALARTQKEHELLLANQDKESAKFKEAVDLAGRLAAIPFAKGHEEAVRALEKQVQVLDKTIELFNTTEDQRRIGVATLEKQIDLNEKYGKGLDVRKDRELALYQITLQQQKKINDLNTITQSVQTGTENSFLAVENALLKGEDAWKAWKDTVVKSLLDVQNEMIKIMILRPALQAIFGGISPMLAGLLGTPGGTPLPGGLPIGMGGIGHAALGGIMTPKGFAPLQTYSTGGVANSPQMAIFGEGRGPEAYVPLPDGRSIPVTLGGEMGGGSNVYVNVHEVQGVKADVRQSRGPNGGTNIDVYLRNMIADTMSNDIHSGGPVSKSLAQQFGLDRTKGLS